jgi:NAD(P)-dependent dehydrogenase (short-subunit alcohol dehydrogenase family)
MRKEMLKDKVIVVTGGAGLIGRSFVEAIAENNGIPVIADIDDSLARAAIENLDSSIRHRVEFVKLDITCGKSIENSIQHLHLKYGNIAALVNNAYPKNDNYGRRFFDVTYEDFVENTGLNLGGYFLTSQKFAKYFQDQSGGNIINIASVYGVIAPRFEIYEGTEMTVPVEYAAIKSGLIHLTKYMAKYFQGHDIRVNSISLGGVLDRQPESFVAKYTEYCLGAGMLLPEDTKGVLMFLLSDLSKHINGQNIIVDNGFTL